MNEEAKGLIYGGFTLFGGTLAALISFGLNRFTLGEIIGITVGGAVIGIALALIVNGILIAKNNK